MAYITEYTELGPKERRQLAYKRQFKKDHPAWDDSMVILRDALASRLGKSVSVLDAGCGRGNFIIDELRDRFSRAVGIDVGREATAKNICLDEIVIGNLEAMPFPDSEFDAVVSLWVLEHVSAPEAVFREIYRVLKPGGVFAFATPNKRSALILLRRRLTYATAQKLVRGMYGREEQDVFPVQYRANTAEEITRLAAMAGFQIDMLQENADPSYTSFGPVSYRISSWLSRTNGALFKPHLIGIVKK